ncbi:MAG: hypothetical protein HYT40_01090 [Candidatus Sungbacteria bacterium]|uniref:Uncharacterized protein n=1 Tax=Candidatus Sungiibacteriota bacterium TaxID=2750080 RepID=A0A931SCB8_9BACT|nr:hypothetical protein [Candidatus Sungbacteria bacterium]
MPNKIFFIFFLLIIVGGPWAWKNLYVPYVATRSLRERSQELVQVAKEYRVTRGISINIPLEVPAGYFLSDISDPETDPEHKFLLVYRDRFGSELRILESEGTSLPVREDFYALSKTSGFQEVSVGPFSGYYARSDPFQDPERQVLVFLKPSVKVTITNRPRSGATKLPDSDFLRLARGL